MKMEAFAGLRYAESQNTELLITTVLRASYPISPVVMYESKTWALE
jgi:hypothetical protein